MTSASDALAAAYDQIPVQTTGIPEPSYSLSSSGKSVAEKVLHYAAIRLISTASDSQDRIADLTHALIVSPVVSVGLVSAQNGLNYRIDSTYFAIPKSMTVDFPIGKIAYIPRNGDSSALANVVQQSRSLLTASELAARESELLSELTEQPTVSALTFLQFAELNNQPVMRIHKVGNLYVDDWATISNSTSDLLSWFPGATADFTNRIQQQVDDGGIITAFRSWWVINNIGRYGWLHESYVEKTGPNTFVPRITPIIESLLMERNSGNVYRGGVADDISNASGAALQSQSVATPDTNQGILRKADTDFTFSIPGFAVPFTRTWTSSRSDLSDVARVVSGGNLSDFGAGWTHPFAQQLAIETSTGAVPYNSARKGAATVIAWKRPDGITGVFSETTETGTDPVLGLNYTVYSNPTDLPGITVRRIDQGPLPNSADIQFGHYYDVRLADGSVYRFQDFNPLSERQKGSTTAYLTSMSDRFGNAFQILRSLTDGSRIERILDQTTQRILAQFKYNSSTSPVVAGGPGIPEQQRLTFNLVGTQPGQSAVLSFAGEVTGPLAFPVTVASLTDALQKLPKVGANQLSVTALADGSFNVTFNGSNFSGINVPAIGSMISQIEVPGVSGVSGLAAPQSGIIGTRFWNYSYDPQGNLNLVSASESTGTVAAPVPSSNPIRRHSYSWYQRINTSTNLNPLRGERLAGLMKTAASYAGTGDDVGENLDTEFKYFGNGRLRSIEDQTGATTHLIYNAYQGFTSIVDVQGHTTTNRFSSFGELAEVISLSGDRTFYDMAPNVRQVAKTTSTSGRSESWEYDAKGNTTLHTDAAGISQIMTYHPVYNQIATITERTSGGTLVPVMTNTYFTDNAAGHAIGALATSTDALNNVTSYRYSTAATTTGKGLIAEIISPKGHSTQFDRLGYDVFGNPVVVDHKEFINNALTLRSSDQTVRDNTGNVDNVKDYNRSSVLQKSTDFTYDQLGRLTAILAPDPYIATAALSTQYLYGRNGLIERRINPDGTIYRHEYDNAGRALREIRPDGTFTSVEYNVNGTVASQTDAIGNKTRFVYDVLNRLSQTIFANGTSRSLLYNAKGDLISETDERGSVTKYEYDAAGRLTKTIDPAGNETSIGYDAFGNQSTAESAVGVVTTTFNAAHQPVQVVYETKATVNGVVVKTKVRVDRIFYDANGNQERSDIIDLRSDPVKMTAAMIASLTDSTVTRSESDTIDTKWKRITTTTFDFRDKPISSTDAGLNTSSQTYSLGTLLTSTTDTRLGKTQFGYDLGGGLQYEALPYVNSTEVQGLSRVMRRDKMGRVVEVQETPYSLNAGAVVRNVNGEPTAPANSEAARISKTLFDALGRPIATQNAMGFVTRVTFDPAGNVVETIDASRRSTLSILDNMNRVVKQILPTVSVAEISTQLELVLKTTMPVITTEYDPAGNVIAATDSAGKTTTLEYDLLNRMILKTSPAVSVLTTDATPVIVVVSPTWSWTYDALGHVATSTDPLGRVTITTSNMFGQVISSTLPDPDGGDPLASSVTEFTFDAFGNLLTVLDKGSPSTTTDDRLTVNEYNSLNLKTKATLPVPGNGIAAPVLQWAYDAVGNLVSSTDARTYTTNYTYDLWSRVIKTELPAVNYGTGTARPTMLTLYDVFGDVIRSTDAMGRSTTFEHDALGRTVWTLSPNPFSEAWSGLQQFASTTQFDAVGNVMRTFDQLGRQSTIAYDNLNRVIRTNGTDPYTDDLETAPSATVFYDINGNVAQQIDASGHMQRFRYDALNRVVLVGIQDGSAWAVTQSWYDRVGNLTRTNEILGDFIDRITDYSYNGWNQLTKVQLPAAESNGVRATTTTTYDQFGNVKTVTDPLGGTTDSQYDNLNRIIRQLRPEPASGITRPESVFAYDAAGNLYKTQVLVSRSSGNVEVWTESVTSFDAINRSVNSVIRGERIADGATLTAQQIAAQTLTSQTYDLVGNVLTGTDAQGRVTAFEYDRLNRKITEIAPKPTATDSNPISRFQYDVAGNLAAMIDPLGRISTYTYDLLDRALTTTSPDPDGPQGPLSAPQLTFRYDVLGNLLSTTDQLGRQTGSVYDTRNRLVSVTQPDPNPNDSIAAPTSTMVYNIAGNKIRSTDTRGNVTDYEYDLLNRLKSVTLPDASPNDRLGRPVTLYGYDLVGNVVTTTDAAGRVTDNGYDKLNRLTWSQLPDPDGVGIGRRRPLTLFQYDAVGNVLVTADYINAGMNRVTQNEYDYLNRVTKTTSPAPTAGAPLSVTNYGYDKVGNQTTVTQTSTASNAIQKTTKFVFDNLNRLVQTESPNPATGVFGGGPTSVSAFDLVGRLVSSKDPVTRITSYFYDDLDRLKKVVGADPDGVVGGATTDKIPSETRTFYDTAGNVAMTQSRQKPDPLTAAMGTSSLGIFSTTINRYDRLDRVTSTMDANGGVTQYRYDNSGNRVQLTDASFNTTRWQFDAQGQVLSETDANRRSIVNEFDLVGNIAAVTDRRGYRTQFVRDNLDNVLREQWLQPGGSGVAFVSQIENWYDNYRRRSWTQQRTMATGQLSSIISLTMDDLDRVKVYDTVTTPGQSAAKLTYQYDAFGNRTQRVQQTGVGASLITVTTNYTDYDYLNRLTKLNQSATNFPSWQNKSVKLDYRADSSIQTITRYSDLTQTTVVVKTDFLQDFSGRLSSITHTKTVPSSTVLASYQYTYFSDDQLLQEISSVDGTTNNDYDAYGQLITSTKTAGTSEAYVYDKTGNRIVGSTVVGKGNRILNDGTYAFVYDGNGNLTRRTTLVNGAPTGAYVQYSWDHRNQLTKVEFYNAPVNGTATLAKTVAYTYDDSSNRINKTLTVPGQAVVAENYVYDGDQLVAVMNATGAIEHQYFDGSSLDQVFADQTVLSGVLWPLEDRTGAARDVISTAGVVLDHRKIDSFGKITSQTGPTVDYDQFFSGLSWDADSQLYYARARWYDPVGGKFIGEDPLRFGAGDTNLSRYGANDPVNNADPSGLSWFSQALKQVSRGFENVGDFFEDNWENGNIQKGLLVAGTIVSGGALAFGGLAGMGLVAGGLGFGSGLANSYEVFSGNQIGDGTFTRVLTAAAAVTGGFYGTLPTGSTGPISSSGYWSLGRGASIAAGATAGYEIASGRTIGDGTLSGVFQVANLGVNQGRTLFTGTATQSFGVGINIAAGGASLFNTGDRGLQQALRSLSIATGVWNTGTEAVAAYQTSKATLEALRPTPIQLRSGGSGSTAVTDELQPMPGKRQAKIRQVSGEGFGDVRLRDATDYNRGLLDAEVGAFMVYLEHENNGRSKDFARNYAALEYDAAIADMYGERSTAVQLRGMLRAAIENDYNNATGQLHGTAEMVAAHDRAKQQAARVVGTFDEYTFGAMSAMGELSNGITYAINKDTYYSSFQQYDCARRIDDILMSVADPIVGLTVFSRTNDPTLARMDREQAFNNYHEYRTEGYDLTRDPGQGKGLFVTTVLMAAATPIAGELAGDVYTGLRNLARNESYFASSMDAHKIFGTAKTLWADEAGTIQTGYGAFGSGDPAPTARTASRIVPGGGLTAHERAGGHLIAKHIGLTDAQLAARLAAEPRISGSSSFGSRTLAESGVSAALDAEQSAISSWLSGTRNRMAVNHNTGSMLGRSLSRGATSAVDSQSVRVVLQRAPSFPGGFRIITGFPTP